MCTNRRGCCRTHNGLSLCSKTDSHGFQLRQQASLLRHLVAQ